MSWNVNQKLCWIGYQGGPARGGKLTTSICHVPLAATNVKLLKSSATLTAINLHQKLLISPCKQFSKKRKNSLANTQVLMDAIEIICPPSFNICAIAVIIEVLPKLV